MADTVMIDQRAHTCEIPFNETVALQEYSFVPRLFQRKDPELARLYSPWGRCLALIDQNFYNIFGDCVVAYFESFGISISARPLMILEEKKNLSTLSDICTLLRDFELIRREPVLVIGGGLITDTVGFACSIYRRGTGYIRIPTTLIGLIDASVSNRVAINWENRKNRLGAFHSPLRTFLDSSVLATLPEAELRNGMAEIIKIVACTSLRTFEMLEEHAERLVKTQFAQILLIDNPLRAVAEAVLKDAVLCVLKAEGLNHRDENLDRVMFFGHTWSPKLELAADPPLLHGHAVSIDICFSSSLACLLGLLTKEDKLRIVGLCSQIGLALDHPLFTEQLLQDATESTIRNRDGLLRAPLPVTPLGHHKILSSVPLETLKEALSLHKTLARSMARRGDGIEMEVSIRSSSGNKANGGALARIDNNYPNGSFP